MWSLLAPGASCRRTRSASCTASPAQGRRVRVPSRHGYRSTHAAPPPRPAPPLRPAPPVAYLLLVQGDDKGVFEAEACGDDEHRRHALEHGAKQHHAPHTRIDGQLRQVVAVGNRRGPQRRRGQPTSWRQRTQPLTQPLAKPPYLPERRQFLVVVERAQIVEEANGIVDSALFRAVDRLFQQRLDLAQANDLTDAGAGDAVSRGAEKRLLFSSSAPVCNF